MEKASNKGTTPLLVACLANQTAVALDLLKAKADPNRRWYGTSGDTPLNFAQQADNTELLFALVMEGADVTVLYKPLMAKCMLGDAHAARRLLLETPSPTPPGAPPSGGEAEG